MNKLIALTAKASPQSTRRRIFIIILNTFLLFFVLVSGFANAKSINYEPVMVNIPGGNFFMGDQRKEGQNDEVPVHMVKIKGFRLSKTEITVGQYHEFVQDSWYAGGSTCWANDESNEVKELPLHWMSLKMAPSDNHPVVCISWEDAKAYTTWLAKKTGKKYRLPTEAEWEYAARAGGNDRFFYGNDLSQICNYGNVRDLSGSSVYGWDNDLTYCEDLGAFTTEVGTYKANRFGLYDMIGNAWEWTEDCYHDSYIDAPSDGSAWTAKKCEFRVYRGGAWFDWSHSTRSANRGRDEPSTRNSGYGFRIAQDI